MVVQKKQATEHHELASRPVPGGKTGALKQAYQQLEAER